MSEEIQNATPAVQESAEQVHEVESNSSEATTGQTQEVTQETQEQTEQAKKEPWFQKRINEQTRKYYEEARKRQDLEQRLAQYEQRQQYQAPEGEEQSQYQPPVDVNSLAEQKAAQMIAERSFTDQCNKVYEAGSKELPDFTAAVSNLQLVGVNREFLEAVTATDAGHKILHHLGQLDNLGEAERILSLPPVQMGRELAKLETKLSQPVTKPVSNAPAPITPIGAGGATESGLRDDLSIEEWTARRNKQLRG